MYKPTVEKSWSKELGKITSSKFGNGGYQDCMIGLSLSFEGKNMGCGDFIRGGWDYHIIPDEHTRWTEEDRMKEQNEMVKAISNILIDAKCSTIDELVGKPVEMYFESNTVKGWRILTEVL